MENRTFFAIAITALVILALLVAFAITAHCYFFRLQIINYNFSIIRCKSKKNEYSIRMRTFKPYYNSYKENIYFFIRNLEHLMLSFKPGILYTAETHMAIINRIKRCDKIEIFPIEPTKLKNLTRLKGKLGNHTKEIHQSNSIREFRSNIPPYCAKQEKVQMYRVSFQLKR